MRRICIVTSYREIRHSMKVISTAFYLVEYLVYMYICNAAVKKARNALLVK